MTSSAKKPVYTKIVKESLKSVILSGESNINKFVSHRFLYYLGFLTGWNPKIFSLEFIPISYFLIWAIVLFALQEISYALIFLITGLVILVYFLLLHTVISSWDRIRHWLIRRAIKRGGMKELQLQDIKYLLIFTRKVFGVKHEILPQRKEEFEPETLRHYLKRNRFWRYFLNGSIITIALLISFGAIYGIINNIDLLLWLKNWWILIFFILYPIIFSIIMLYISKIRIRNLINDIPLNEFEKVLRVLNEFEIFGAQENSK